MLVIPTAIVLGWLDALDLVGIEHWLYVVLLIAPTGLIALAALAFTPYAVVSALRRRQEPQTDPDDLMRAIAPPFVTRGSTFSQAAGGLVSIAFYIGSLLAVICLIRLVT